MFSQFEARRKELGKSIDDIEKALKIRKRYLIAIESGDVFEALPRAYANGYLKMYADYLGIENPNSRVHLDEAHQNNYTTLSPFSKFFRNNFLKICFIGMILIAFGFHYFIT